MSCQPIGEAYAGGTRWARGHRNTETFLTTIYIIRKPGGRRAQIHLKRRRTFYIKYTFIIILYDVIFE